MLTATNESDYTRFFRHFGLSLRTDQQQLNGDCPFPDCAKPVKHFYANPSTGQWDCKYCGRSGNVYTFMEQFHTAWLSATTEDHYRQLVDARPGLLLATVQDWQLAYNTHLDEWLIPSFNRDNRLTCLYVWRDRHDDQSNRWYKAILCPPSIKQSLYGLNRLRPEKHRPLFILEGHWDTLAFHGLLTTTVNPKSGHLLIEDYDCLGMPGAATFPKEYFHLLDGRDVRLLLDNDAAGRNGTESFVKKLAANNVLPSAFYALRWPSSGLSDGYDVRDLITDSADTRKAFKFLLSNLHPQKIEIGKTDNESYDPDLEPTPCTSFDELLDCCREGLYVTQGFEDTLAVMLAVNVSLKLGGPPLWLHTIAPASSGKTTLVSLIAAAHTYCYSLSKMTGVFSGFQGRGDASLLPRFQDRTVIIKDFTTLLSGPATDAARIFGELRDLYDGSASTAYRNRKANQYNNIRFTIITCVTDAIRRYNLTELGERFLQIEIDSYYDEQGRYRYETRDRKEYVRRAITNVLSNMAQAETTTRRHYAQKAKAWGFLDHLHSSIARNPQILIDIATAIQNDAAFIDWVTDLAQWVAYARATVDRDRDHQILYRARVEFGTRLAEQLTKLTAALCVVFQTVQYTDRIRQIIRKVALDTGSGFQQEIMLAMSHSPTGMTREQIASCLGLKATTIHNRIQDMLELGILTFVKNGNGKGLRGRDVHIYRLTPELDRLARSIGFR